MNEHEDDLPASVVAVYVTTVVPKGKAAPDVCVEARVAEQPPLTVGAVHVATALQEVPTTWRVILAGQPTITGLPDSSTTTLNVHNDEFPAWSVAVYVTAVVPIENVPPGK